MAEKGSRDSALTIVNNIFAEQHKSLETIKTSLAAFTPQTSVAAFTEALKPLLTQQTQLWNTASLLRPTESLQAALAVPSTMASAFERLATSNLTIGPISSAVAFVPPVSLASLSSEFAKLSSIAVSASQLLANASLPKFSDALLISGTAQQSLQASLTTLYKSANAVWLDVARSPIALTTRSAALLERPSVETYAATRAASLLSRAPEPAEGISATAERFLDGAADELESRLASLDPSLVVPYRGAIEVLVGTTPDRVRHFSTSFRELLTHVLHTLAPDGPVTQWTTAPEHFDRGRPTRRARLRYVYRDVTIGTLSQFIESDIEAALAFFDALHQGTHQLVAPFSPIQLRIMTRRAQGLLSTLLEAGGY